MRYAAQRSLTLPRERVFATVADVERYPEFVPGWSEVRIRQREPDRLVVEQVVARGPLRWVLVSEAFIRPPDAIRIRALSGPIRSLEIRWRFEAPAPARCIVGLELAAEGGSSLVARLLGAGGPRAAAELIDLFARRARAAGD